MSGHSKWSTIKHQKGAKDAKRGKLFTKIGRMITLAAREGGGNPEANFKLRLAVEKARQANMPQNNIAKAIKRGTGESGEEQIEEMIYEAVGPGGLAMIIRVTTDNKNRTLSELKHILGQHNAKLATTGSLSWQFKSQGIVVLDLPKLAEDQELTIIEAGAEDIQSSGGKISIYTKPADLQSVKETLEKAKIAVQSAELGYRPKNPIKIELAQVEGLLNALDEHDDVQEIYTNLGNE